jgi:hypothetical protein
METVLNLIKPLFEMYSSLLPAGVVGVLAFIGTLRIVVKPLLSLAYTIASLTPSQKDDLAIKKIEEGKLMKAVLYCLDWIASVKMPAKK